MANPISCSEYLSFKSWPWDWLTLLKFSVIFIGCSSQMLWEYSNPATNLSFHALSRQSFINIPSAPLTLVAAAVCDTPALCTLLAGRRSFCYTCQPPPGLILWPQENVTRCGEVICVKNACVNMVVNWPRVVTNWTWRIVCAINWTTQRHRLCDQTLLSRRRIWNNNIQMKHRKTVRGNVTWIELAQDHVPWQTLALVLLKLWVLLPEEQLIINPLNAELNSICHLLALLGAHHIFAVSGLRVNMDLSRLSCGDGIWNRLKTMSKCQFWY